MMIHPLFSISRGFKQEISINICSVIENCAKVGNYIIADPYHPYLLAKKNTFFGRGMFLLGQKNRQFLDLCDIKNLNETRVFERTLSRNFSSIMIGQK